MTENVNPEPFIISDGLIVRNVNRNVVGSREQLSLQTKLLRWKARRCIWSPEEDCSRRLAQRLRTSAGWKPINCAWNVKWTSTCKVAENSEPFPNYH